MDPALAGITAYVSQDCTGVKDDPAVDKTGYWAQCPNWPFFSHHVSAAGKLWGCLEMWQEAQQTHPLKKSTTSQSNFFLSTKTWVLIHSTARAEGALVWYKKENGVNLICMLKS